MSADSNLQEMENVVTQNAAPAEPMQASGVPYEDLGGPTPENSRPDDDSNKLETPGKTLAQVKNVVNAKAVKAEEVEADEEQEIVAEEEEVTEEEITEEEVSEEEEVVTEEEDTEPEFSIEEDVQALFEGEELSEEFQEKARTIFEAAISSKVAEIKENLQSAYESVLVEEIETIKEGLTERLDAYLEYVADEWIQENALAVEHGLKTEMTESFLSGMKGLFEEHYVTIPEDRYDVIESMVDKLDEMEAKLNEQIERNIALNRRLAESVADVIFAEISEGLALSQREKLASLAENVEFDSEADYREKLVTLRNSYFSGTASAQKTVTENLSEEVSTEDMVGESYSPSMGAYLDMLGRVAKK